MLEKDTNPMPQMDLFPQITKITKALINLFSRESEFDHPFDTELYGQDEIQGAWLDGER